MFVFFFLFYLALLLNSVAFFMFLFLVMSASMIFLFYYVESVCVIFGIDSSILSLFRKLPKTSFRFFFFIFVFHFTFHLFLISKWFLFLSQSVLNVIWSLRHVCSGAKNGNVTWRKCRLYYSECESSDSSKSDFLIENIETVKIWLCLQIIQLKWRNSTRYLERFW